MSSSSPERQPAPVSGVEHQPARLDMISGQVDAEIAREFRALLEREGKSIRFAIHQMIEEKFAGADVPSQLRSKLKAELAKFGPSGRVKYVRRAPTKWQD